MAYSTSLSPQTLPPQARLRPFRHSWAVPAGSSPSAPACLSNPSINYTSLVLAGSTNQGANLDLALGGPATTGLLGDVDGGFSFGQTYAISESAFISGSVVQSGSNGNTNLVFFTAEGVTYLPGNGDGTFQGLPNLPVGPTGFVTANTNGDGLSDVVYINAAGNLVTTLSRGNGTFAVTNQILATASEFLLAGDSNADGHADMAAILPGSGPAGDSQLFFYKGKGDGSLQAASAAVDLYTIGAIYAITGDFNGDGHLDMVVSSIDNEEAQRVSPQALVLLPGKGDGTFGTAVPFSSFSSFDFASSLFSTTNSTTMNPGTPNGVQSVTVSATDSTNNILHTFSFQLTVQ